MSEFKRGFIIPIGVIALTSALLMKEPHFGTSAFVAILSLIMLVVGGTRIIFVCLTAMSFVPFIHTMLFEVSYRKDRLMAFVGQAMRHNHDLEGMEDKQQISAGQGCPAKAPGRFNVALVPPIVVR